MLAVIAGAVGVEEVEDLVEALPEDARVTVAACAILPDAVGTLTKLSKGSKILKIPRDVLARSLRAVREEVVHGG